ncbi:hypothetical protein TNCV_2796171 [Trichonephila clavipes]|nr:hypothetical protein TNCV_2796171 [Trichonephila clavipes]
MSSGPVPTDDVVSRVFIESNALEKVVAIHYGVSVSKLSSQWPKFPMAFRGFWVTVVYVSVNVGNNALCTPESQGDFRLS